MPAPDYPTYRRRLLRSAELGIELDTSRIDFPAGFEKAMAPRLEAAFVAMARLEAGAIANPDENRRVGHYWLRRPDLAPDAQTREAIAGTLERLRHFVARVHRGEIRPPGAGRFTDLLVAGIGGSALGPQLVADALGAPGSRRDAMRPHFLDNTDPDGFEQTFRALGRRLGRTLVLVISKSGTTPETRNGMLAARDALEKAGLDFPARAVAVTGTDSALETQARQEGWLESFPMWDFVGGRTSLTSAVGLLPAALQGIDIDALLEGAAAMDAWTRTPDTGRNPAARLALAWHHETGGRGERAMVVLPYKDRLLLLSRYLQQLVMESLGKREDRRGERVHQGLTVYGNKGSTDQHAFVQQLRDGRHDFFVNFVLVRRDRPTRPEPAPLEVEPGITAGDYLHGFWLGTRRALTEAGRGSITLTLERLDPRSLGALIALYERAVGLYAELIDVNAYHQPGVEAGKKAARQILALQQRATAHLADSGGALTVPELAEALGVPEEAETLEHLLDRLAAGRRGIRRRHGRYRAAT